LNNYEHFITKHLIEMKLQGKEFDGSNSLFETHQLLQSAAGSTIWITEFHPIKRKNLNLASYYYILCVR